MHESDETYSQGAVLLWSIGLLASLFVLLMAIQYDARDLFSETIRDRLAAAESSWPPALTEFYEARNYAPRWVVDRRLSFDAEELLATLNDADLEGLRPSDYPGDALLTGRTPNTRLPASMDSLLDLELALTRAYTNFASHVLGGRVDPSTIHSGWIPLPRTIDTPALALLPVSEAVARLRPASNDYDALRNALIDYRHAAAQGGWRSIGEGADLEPGSTDARVCDLRLRLSMPCDDAKDRTYDDSLARAVKSFQRRHGLEPDGIVSERTLAALNVPVEKRIEQIELNMERRRWMPRGFGPRYIVVNLPDYSLEARGDGAEPLRMKIVAGTVSTPTEVFHTTATQVVLAPYWFVPRSIASEDIVPILKRDASYLSRNRFTVFLRGEAVDPGRIDWSEYSAGDFPYTLRQDPGGSNPLGRLRFTMPNRFDISMHDTVERRLFDRFPRPFSHGCIRLEKPAELALFALEDSAWNHDRIQGMVKTGKESVISLKEPIPVYVVYWTVWVDAEGALQFRDDVYGHDAKLAKMLFSKHAD